MKRWLSKLAVFLLLGAIVNVGAAWGYHVGDSEVCSACWKLVPCN
ncbi:MAG: hypothetical protein V3T53_15160 [Phycisphaerales bacterium]